MGKTASRLPRTCDCQIEVVLLPIIKESGVNLRRADGRCRTRSEERFKDASAARCHPVICRVRACNPVHAPSDYHFGNHYTQQRSILNKSRVTSRKVPTDEANDEIIVPA
eukprot:6190182-Pleurochrysis_carterae.AAC.4